MINCRVEFKHIVREKKVSEGEVTRSLDLLVVYLRENSRSPDPASTISFIKNPLQSVQYERNMLFLCIFLMLYFTVLLKICLKKVFLHCTFYWV